MCIDKAFCVLMYAKGTFFYIYVGDSLTLPLWTNSADDGLTVFSVFFLFFFYLFFPENRHWHFMQTDSSGDNLGEGEQEKYHQFVVC